MSIPIRTTLHRWARASNRRRFAEEALFAATWVAMGIVVAAGLIRLGELAVDLGWATGRPWPSKTAQWAFAAWAIGWIAKITVPRALWRYRKRRTRPEALARRLDTLHRTDGLFVTALGLERGDRDGAPAFVGDPRLAASIVELARSRLTSLHAPIDPLREPLRTLAGIGIAAGLLALLPSPEEALALQQRWTDALRRPPPVHSAALSPETAARLARAVAPLVDAPNLPDGLVRAVQGHLEQAQAEPGTALVALARAQAELSRATPGLADLPPARADAERSPRASSMTEDSLADLPPARADAERSPRASSMTEDSPADVPPARADAERAALQHAASELSRAERALVDATNRTRAGPSHVPLTRDAYVRRYLEAVAQHERTAP